MLVNRLAREGDWLFRRRCLLPLAMLAPIVWSLTHLRDYVGHSHALQHAVGAVCCGVSWLGWLIRATTVGYVPGGTSGRNTTSQRAESLNVRGWYSVTRNPLYFGNFVIGLGIVSAWLDPQLVLTYTVVFWLYYERIIAREEEFLFSRFGAAYRDWAARTPAFMPAIRGWRQPACAFSLRTVLRREYSAILLIGVAYELIDVGGHLLFDRRMYLDWSWSVHCAACVLAFATLRMLKKRTDWLQVAGR